MNSTATLDWLLPWNGSVVECQSAHDCFGPDILVDPVCRFSLSGKRICSCSTFVGFVGLNCDKVTHYFVLVQVLNLYVSFKCVRALLRHFRTPSIRKSANQSLRLLVAFCVVGILLILFWNALPIIQIGTRSSKASFDVTQFISRYITSSGSLAVTMLAFFSLVRSWIVVIGFSDVSSTGLLNFKKFHLFFFSNFVALGTSFVLSAVYNQVAILYSLGFLQGIALALVIRNLGSQLSTTLLTFGSITNASRELDNSLQKKEHHLRVAKTVSLASSRIVRELGILSSYYVAATMALFLFPILPYFVHLDLLTLPTLNLLNFRVYQELIKYVEEVQDNTSNYRKASVLPAQIQGSTGQIAPGLFSEVLQSQLQSEGQP